jgi:RNA polymerase sigma-70 factor (ECF subfamily)
MQDFSDFYGAQKDRVFRVVLAAGGRHAVAEDAVAEAFARAFARWSTVRTHGNPSAWVMLTALNVQRSWWRRVRREVLQAVPDQVTDTGMTPEVPVHLQRCVAALPRRQREVLALRVLGELSPGETADVLGIAVGTVGVHLSRALTTLRRSTPAQSSPPDDRPGRITGMGGADFRRVDA